MSDDFLTAEARQENALALAAAAGIDASTAAEQLKVAITITRTPSRADTRLSQELQHILRRTVQSVESDSIAPNTSLEVIIGGATRRTAAPTVYVTVGTNSATISGTKPTDGTPTADIHGLLVVIVACYAAAASLHGALSGMLPVELPDPLVIDFDQLGFDRGSLNRPCYLRKAYLAGAGAIGNAFLWAARHVDVCGQLIIVDDDVVSSGNLNRQIWFTRDDIGKGKAERLIQLAQADFPNLTLSARSCRLQEVPEKTDGPWLECLIVAVDSRRARRQLQNEFPREVFDASTTDIREIVIHHHAEPNSHACLSCIYEIDVAESDREAHIAEHLGVSVDEVRTERISTPAAIQIHAKFPSLGVQRLSGMAYDSLFKQLCSEKQLRSVEGGKPVVAPFGFVSILAGALLVVEILRQTDLGHTTSDNYWRVSPWHPPLPRRRILRPKQQLCNFCGNQVLVRINKALWS